uniref:Uncharacterized protein n=1 Tax=Fundulus heteroclitus TaxID=8078 RepID=A0A3Q2Q2Z4_FUNHE
MIGFLYDVFVWCLNICCDLMFSTRHSGGGAIMIWGHCFWQSVALICVSANCPIKSDLDATRRRKTAVTNLLSLALTWFERSSPDAYGGTQNSLCDPVHPI